MKPFLALPLLLLAARASAGPLAAAARLDVGTERLVVGERSAVADQLLDCRPSKVQHTIRQCALKPSLAATAASVGRRVRSASVTLNFLGDVINMSVEYEAALGADVLLSDYAAALASRPKTQYWADDDHLYASSIWIDGDTEVELSRVVKGAPSAGGVRVFVSRLSGNPLLSPDDAP